MTENMIPIDINPLLAVERRVNRAHTCSYYYYSFFPHLPSSSCFKQYKIKTTLPMGQIVTLVSKPIHCRVLETAKVRFICKQMFDLGQNMSDLRYELCDVILHSMSKCFSHKQQNSSKYKPTGNKTTEVMKPVSFRISLQNPAVKREDQKVRCTINLINRLP